MYIFRFIWKRLSKLWRSGGILPPEIDCHKWESKVEIFRTLSSKR